MIARIRGLLWPRSLQGQLLLAVAMALLLAQTISAVLLYRAQNDRREAALIHTAAIRIVTANREATEEQIERRRPGSRLLAAARQLHTQQSICGAALGQQIQALAALGHCL